MLSSERKGGIVAGFPESSLVKEELAPWRARPRIPQGPDYQYTEFGKRGLYRAATHVSLGESVPVGIPGANLYIEGLNAMFPGTEPGPLFRGSVSVRLASLSELVEHLIPGVMRAIDASRGILGMGPDHDGEGSVGYSESTWLRATEFLKRSALALRIHHQREVPAPRVLHGPEGGIDLHWKTDSHELLINIPSNSDEPADFYGDSGRSNTIKGKLDTSAQNEWILMWLMS